MTIFSVSSAEAVPAANDSAAARASAEAASLMVILPVLVRPLLGAAAD
jgi:hypothetical protein